LHTYTTNFTFFFL